MSRATFHLSNCALVRDGFACDCERQRARGQGVETTRVTFDFDVEVHRADLQELRLGDTHSSDVDPGRVDPWEER